MNVKSFIRTLFKCSNHDKEIEERLRADEERRRRLRTAISKKAESISHKAREVEAGAELLTLLKKDQAR